MRFNCKAKWIISLSLAQPIDVVSLCFYALQTSAKPFFDQEHELLLSLVLEFHIGHQSGKLGLAVRG